MVTILVIEDNEDVRENTAEILQLANYKVFTAEDGNKGVKMAKLTHPDIIICDIMMPNFNGYQVLSLLNEDKRTASIPFIFLSAKTERKAIRKGMNLGADDYLTKPFDEDELLQAVASRLKKNRSLKKEFSKEVEGLHQFFNEVSVNQSIENLSKDRQKITFNKKDLLFMEGDAAQALYFIQEGAVKAFKSTESGKSLVTGLFGPGQFLGQLSLLTEKGVYNHTAEALEYTEVYVIPKADFIKLLYGDALISNKFIAMISNDLIDLHEQLVTMAFSSVRERLAKVLLELYNKENLYNSKNMGIQISREDLASLIGTATETTIRMLTSFKEEQLVSIGVQHEIIITNLKKIEEIIFLS